MYFLASSYLMLTFSFWLSYSALINRLRELRLLECRPIEEYIDHALFPKASI